MAYMDEVVRPTLPSLARQYQNDLSDVFKSLRVPADPGNSEAPNLEYRDWHQGLFDRSMERAFLTALEFSLRAAQTDTSNRKYAFYVPRVTEEFDEYNMTVASDTVADHELTEGSKVTMCLCPVSNLYRVAENNREPSVTISSSNLTRIGNLLPFQSQGAE